MKDTSVEAAAIQAGIYRKLTGAARLALAVEMSVMMRSLAASRLKGSHPEWSESRLQLELLVYAFGKTPLPPQLG